jgi:uncharacterized membrane protein SirB2
MINNIIINNNIRAVYWISTLLMIAVYVNNCVIAISRCCRQEKSIKGTACFIAVGTLITLVTIAALTNICFVHPKKYIFLR